MTPARQVLPCLCTFVALAGSKIRVEAEREGNKKVVVRTFHVRKEVSQTLGPTPAGR